MKFHIYALTPDAGSDRGYYPVWFDSYDKFDDAYSRLKMPNLENARHGQAVMLTVEDRKERPLDFGKYWNGGYGVISDNEDTLEYNVIPTYLGSRISEIWGNTSADTLIRMYEKIRDKMKRPAGHVEMDANLACILFVCEKLDYGYEDCLPFLKNAKKYLERKASLLHLKSSMHYIDINVSNPLSRIVRLAMRASIEDHGRSIYNLRTPMMIGLKISEDQVDSLLCGVIKQYMTLADIVEMVIMLDGRTFIG